ncbi:hypothetical protein [Vibrio vulnificus]|uniref:Uncharacterized protein n=1 Tax=Vibrio vulnificus TaxID=672 RepID=A0A2S3R8C9_VIBVL|nr:hypothetical protein [Vibrio vulnificus]POB49963.1 hypothetical protein CRN52_01400 [Vibrio vulnificus]
MSKELLKMIDDLTLRVEALEKKDKRKQRQKNKPKKPSALESVLHQMLVDGGCHRYSIQDAGVDLAHLSQPIHALRGMDGLEIESNKDRVRNKSVTVYKLTDESKDAALNLLNYWRIRRGEKSLSI